MAISCVSPTTLDDRIESSFSANAERAVILIWSFHDPIHPQLILEAPDDVNSFQFNPEEPHIIVAGCGNGQIALWYISEFQDKLYTTRKSSSDSEEDAATIFTGKDRQSDTPRLSYLLCSSIESSHRSAITDLKWLPKTSEVTCFVIFQHL